MRSRLRPALRTSYGILLAALCLSMWDLLFARIYWNSEGVTLVRVLQSVASGIYGKASRNGGVKTAIVGAVCHYFIALCMVLAYFLVSRGVGLLPWVSLRRFSLFLHESGGAPALRYRPPGVWRSSLDGLEHWHARTFWGALRADSTSHSTCHPTTEQQPMTGIS